MVHDRTHKLGQTCDTMFNSKMETSMKSNMSYGVDDKDIDISSYFAQSSGSGADMLGQSHVSSAFFGQQKNGASVLGNRLLASQQPFGRSMPKPASQVAPNSAENSNPATHSRGLLSIARNAMSGGQMSSSQVGNSILSTRPSLPSPTIGVSPKDFFNMKQQSGNKNVNAAVSRNHSFSSQSQMMPMNAIGSESLSQLRHHQALSGSSPDGVNSSIANIHSFNLDQSEFPALAQRTRPIGSQPASVGGSKPPYGGMVNKQNESNEFQIQNEDFPALPGAAMNVMKAVFPDHDGKGDEPNSKFNPLGSLQIGGRVTVDKTSQKGTSSSQQKGMQVLPDNVVKNIPGTMQTDQYGIVGLFAFIKAAETDPTLVQLALGNDLTTLGLNLNSPDNLYNKFQSPFSRQPCRLQDIDFFVPSEYLTNTHIRDKLAPIKLNKYGEDLLFYVYYSNSGDVLQLAAAAELYNRDWRFHKEERMWITRMPGIEPRMKTNTYEQGTYYYFDCQNWRKVAKEFHLEYDKLEDRPHLPNLVSLHFNPVQQE